MANELIVNIDKIHTTIMGIDRIKKNINIDGAVVDFCKNILNTNITKKVGIGIVLIIIFLITVNAYSYTIITEYIIK